MSEIHKAKKILLKIFLALSLSIATYLVVILCFFKVLSSSFFLEEILYNTSIKENISFVDGDQATEKMQKIVNSLPPFFLPHNYSNIKIRLIKNESINAFASFGGNIFITTAMVKNVNDHALLFAIGHEISHLVRKDHIYEYSRSLVNKICWLLTRSDIISELLILIEFKKNQEIEVLSDLHAIKIVKHVYGNYDGILDMFKLIREKKIHNNLDVSEVDFRLEKLNKILS